MSSGTRTIEDSAAGSGSVPGDSSVRAAIVAAILGAGLIFLAGFAEMPQLHEAAHDARHTANFPCH
jgi:cobalt transporter subunit CbtB